MVSDSSPVPPADLAVPPLNVSPASVLDLSREDVIKAALDGDAEAGFLVEAMAQSGEIDDATRDSVRAVHKDGWRPSPKGMAEAEAVQYEVFFSGMDSTAKAAYLFANPEVVPRLTDLARAGAAAAYATLESLVKLDLLEGANLTWRVW